MGPVRKENIPSVQVKNKRVGGTEHVFILASVESTVSNIYSAADLLPKSSSSLCTVTVAELGESNLLPTTFTLCSYSSFCVCRVGLLHPGRLAWPIHRAQGTVCLSDQSNWVLTSTFLRHPCPDYYTPTWTLILCLNPWTEYETSAQNTFIDWLECIFS